MRGDVRSTHAMRLGFRQAKGLKQEEVDELVARRGHGYDSVRDVWLRSDALSPPSNVSPISMRFGRSGSTAAMRCGRRGAEPRGRARGLPLFAERRSEGGKEMNLT
ncbi:MAG: hypothetical protein R3C16_05630 [Hyphomonadaceae bacterium]